MTARRTWAVLAAMLVAWGGCFYGWDVPEGGDASTATGTGGASSSASSTVAVTTATTGSTGGSTATASTGAGGDGGGEGGSPASASSSSAAASSSSGGGPCGACMAMCDENSGSSYAECIALADCIEACDHDDLCELQCKGDYADALGWAACYDNQCDSVCSENIPCD